MQVDIEIHTGSRPLIAPGSLSLDDFMSHDRDADGM